MFYALAAIAIAKATPFSGNNTAFKFHISVFEPLFTFAFSDTEAYPALHFAIRFKVSPFFQILLVSPCQMSDSNCV